MKKLFFIVFLLPLFAMAQKVITHTVGPKESLTSIGRLYNINGRELASYNKIDYDKGLALGQVLKIPVQDGHPKPQVLEPDRAKAAPVVKTEATVKSPAVVKEHTAPVYHVVGKKQTLYAISKLYNVSIADIKKWNNLTDDALTEGAKIIVGNGSNKNVAPVAIKETPEVKEEVKITEPKKPVEEKPVVKEVKEAMQPVKKNEVITSAVNVSKAVDYKGGVFRNIFDEQVKGIQPVTEKGTGGIFKSTSGWEDGKYYCLHNTAATGSVLKITNNATGKTVYAKVLDLIPDIKQNSGLVIRISNAAADALGVTDTQLDCTINYLK
jgi:LysM repeat protein